MNLPVVTRVWNWRNVKNKTPKEFMAAARICRSNFDKLVGGQKIMTNKKGRKIYVVASEVERYFEEVKI